MKTNYTLWFRKSTGDTEQEHERQKKQVKAKENLIPFNFHSKGGQKVDQIAQRNFGNSILDDTDSHYTEKTSAALIQAMSWV